MLPFIKPERKQDAAVATIYRSPDEDKKEDMDGLMAAAEDLLKGIHSHDKNLVVSALKAAFEILDAMPHHEGEHLSSEE
jgi:hypothetical protein